MFSFTISDDNSAQSFIIETICISLFKKIQYDTQAKDTVITQMKVDVSNDPSSI